MKKSSNPIHTFQARFTLDRLSLDLIDRTTQLLSSVSRSLFADIMAGKNPGDLKSSYINQYGITARHFNACRVQIEGKIRSLKELQKNQIENLKDLLKYLEDKKKSPQRICRIQSKIKRLEYDQSNGKVSCCFGGKKLFKAQFNLAKAGYSTHAEWKQEWDQARNDEFFLLGSKDETAGNQSCTATIQDDNKISLRLRIPNSVGKYIEIKDVYFNHGHDQVIASIRSCQERADKRDKQLGEAISYRFKRDKKGWRVFASTSISTPKWISNQQSGVIGVDINIDHLAIAETDRFGNLIYSEHIPLVLYGKTTQQALALIGDACSSVVERAVCARKPIIIERLDFQKKKAELTANYDKRYARMLSSFAYNKISLHLKSQSWKKGIRIHEVNPAFTSLIGRVKFAKRYGITIHQAAALSIGRRFLGFSEQPPRQMDQIPDGKGDFIQLSLPVRNRGKHVWHLWRKVAKEYQVVRAARLRSGKNRSKDPPTPIFATNTKVDGEIPSHESLAILLS
jgi:IS605 OrfB family transposase